MRTARRVGLLASLLAAAAVVSPASAPADHDGPLAGQWHLDQVASDGTTPDSSGHGLTGTKESSGGGIEGTAGRFNDAVAFDGLSAIRVGPSSLLEPTNVTVVAWVRSSGSPGNNKYIVAKGGDGGCGASSYALDTGPTGGLEFYVRSPSLGVGISTPSAMPSDIWDGAWHGVAGVYDGTSIRLYVDGQVVQGGVDAPQSIDYSPANHDFVMGDYPTCSRGASVRLDEVQVYRRALTASEIAALHDPAATSPPTVGGGGGGGVRRRRRRRPARPGVLHGERHHAPALPAGAARRT